MPPITWHLSPFSKKQLEGLDPEFKGRGHPRKNLTLCDRMKYRI